MNKVELRDYFAGLAMELLIEKTSAEDWSHPTLPPMLDHKAYVMADAMLTERDKPALPAPKQWRGKK